MTEGNCVFCAEGGFGDLGGEFAADVREARVVL